MKQITINTAICSGHGRCYTLAPDHFDADDEGYPILLQQDVSEDSAGFEDVQAAVDSCPERAISLDDAT